MLDKSRPTGLLWFSVLARGTVGSVQWASFGVALKCHPKDSCISCLPAPHHCSGLSACLPAFGTDSFSASTTLSRQPKRQICLCHLPTLCASKAPQCLWDKSRMPVRPGCLPLLQLHLSPPVLTPATVRILQFLHWVLLPQVYVHNAPFLLGHFIPSLKCMCTHTHTLIPAHPSGPLCGIVSSPWHCIWVRRASPGPELTYAMAPAHHTGGAPLLTSSSQNANGKRTGTVSISLAAVLPAPSTASVRDKPQWRVISQNSTQEATDCLFCHIFRHLFRGPVHKYLLSLIAPGGRMRRMLKQKINIWKFIGCVVCAMPCNPHNKPIYLVLIITPTL